MLLYQGLLWTLTTQQIQVKYLSIISGTLLLILGVVTGVSLGFILVAICTFVCIYSKCKRKPEKQQSNPNPVQANMEYLQTQNNSQNVELNPVGPYVSNNSSRVVTYIRHMMALF